MLQQIKASGLVTAGEKLVVIKHNGKPFGIAPIIHLVATEQGKVVAAALFDVRR
jgi:hypothetical protein